MPAVAKRKDDHMRVRQFLTDAKGHKMAAVIDIDELKRLETVLDLIPSRKNGFTRTKRPLRVFRGA